MAETCSADSIRLTCTLVTAGVRLSGLSEGLRFSHDDAVDVPYVWCHGRHQPGP